MLLLILAGCAFLLMVLVTGVVEAWARHRGWPGYDTRPYRYDRRRTGGKPW